MAVYLPKRKTKKSKNNIPLTQQLDFRCTQRISRIPFGGKSLSPYVINPSPESLEKDLFEQIEELLKSSPSGVDGQNGNILDNFISNWENCAKASLNQQRASHAMEIMTLVGRRQSDRKNAELLLSNEKKELEKTKVLIEKAEIEYASIHPETDSWRK